MAGIAQLARESGDQVRGCDDNTYPPMSDLLERRGIAVLPGYDPRHLDTGVDLVVVGNALSRGNPLVERMLDLGIPHVSGPEWLHDRVLSGRKVLAVSGTHGKTSTSCMLAWIFRESGLDAGFLIGGQPGNFGSSAALGSGDWFIVEADEYDSAYFDKRPKFMHYRPDILVLNNLEYDHADIFDDLEQIRKQFHYLLRTVPPHGTVVHNQDDPNLRDVLERGCWSAERGMSLAHRTAPWHAVSRSADGSQFDILMHGEKAGQVDWQCIGDHNIRNGMAAVCAAHAAGLSAETSCRHLASFTPPRRRLQLLFGSDAVVLYDDFAHHPGAIRSTLDAVRSRHGDRETVVILALHSNTMRSGAHGQALADSLDGADKVFLYLSRALDWEPGDLHIRGEMTICTTPPEMIEQVKLNLDGNSIIICMGNSGFDGIPEKLAEHLSRQHA